MIGRPSRPLLARTDLLRQSHETYVGVGGEWKYLYRAVDKLGQTVDFLLTARRDLAAARRFFERAMDLHGEPEKVTIGQSSANTSALRGLAWWPIPGWTSSYASPGT